MKIVPNIDEKALRARIEKAFELGVSQLERMLPKWTAGKPAPVYTENGIWTRPDSIWTDWCPGFYAGVMWLAFERTGERNGRGGAEEHTLAHVDAKLDGDVHDLGIVFLSAADRR